jgi:nucleoside-diphosphate-sugar epimerase
MPLTIAVTGADGFIGHSACAELERRGYNVRRITRTGGPLTHGDYRIVPDLAAADGLEALLEGADAVVHLAARAHVVRETEPDPDAAFERSNVVASERLATAAVRAGVRRFVFVSSIGVNGNATRGTPFTESDRPAPAEPYARSKLRAEQALTTAASGALELVVVRPSIVYGAGVKGNFLRLMTMVDSGLPLPLAAVDNRRSLIGVDNLAALLALCVEHSAAAGQLFLAAEPGLHSTPGLLRTIAAALQRPARVIPVAPMRMLAGLGGAARRSTSSAARSRCPPKASRAGLARTCPRKNWRVRRRGSAGGSMLSAEVAAFLVWG